MKNKLCFCIVFLFVLNGLQSQKPELVGLELAKPPSNFEIPPHYNFGTKITFFVKDTAQVTGMVREYKIKEWVTDTGKDLKAEHEQLASQEVRSNYRAAKDTALLEQQEFWLEKGKGFSLKIHSWALPDKKASSMAIEGFVGYTVLDTDEVFTEDITHLAGNFGFETMSLDFRGNTIDLKKVVYGKDQDAYVTFKGDVRNKNYAFAIQKMEFLDSEGKTVDELFFGFNNDYFGASTRNRIDLRNTAVLRIHYQKLLKKKTLLNETFGLGF